MIIVALITVAFLVFLNLLGTASDVVCKRTPAEKKGTSPGARFLVSVLERTGEDFFPEKGRADRQYFDSIYIGEEPEYKRRKVKEKYADAVLLVLFVTCVIYLAAALYSFGNRNKTESLIRPESGTANEKLVAEYKGKTYELSVNVDSIIPNQDAQEEYLDSVADDIKEIILGDNEDLASVKYDLNFDRKYFDENLEIYWSSSDTGVVSSDGKVFSDTLYEEKDVTLTAHLRYFECSREVEIGVTVLPLDEESRIRQALSSRIDIALAAEKEEAEVDLPDSFEGEEVKYSLYRENTGGYILFFGAVIAVLIIPLGYQRKREKLRERNVGLICDYPDVVSKMTMLLEAGSSIRNAFERIAGDYEARKRSGRYKKKKYVYEEMILTANELALGVSEAEAYEAFGRRCGNIYYIRFASLLIQNIKKGNESLLESLYQEVTEARRERQAEIRKKGEEAGIKLLFPMMGMLAIVMAVILIPAFLGM